IYQSLPPFRIQATKLANVLLVLPVLPQRDCYNVCRSKPSYIQLYPARNKRLVERACASSWGEYDQLVDQDGNIAESTSTLVVWPKIFAIWVENDCPYRDANVATLCNRRRALVKDTKEQFVEIGFSESSSRENERPT